MQGSTFVARLALLSLLVCGLGCTGAVIDVYVSQDANGARRLEKLSGQKLPTFTAEARAAYCIVEYSNGREDATIDAVIRQEAVRLPDGSMDDNRDVIVAASNLPASVGENVRSSIALLPRDPDTGRTSDSTPLAAGQYRCEFALRTKAPAPGTAPRPDMWAQFAVAPLECPSSQIFNGDPCGFYPDNQVCAADGARSNKLDQSPTCRCVAAQWQCARVR